MATKKLACATCGGKMRGGGKVATMKTKKYQNAGSVTGSEQGTGSQIAKTLGKVIPTLGGIAIGIKAGVDKMKANKESRQAAREAIKAGTAFKSEKQQTRFVKRENKEQIKNTKKENKATAKELKSHKVGGTTKKKYALAGTVSTTGVTDTCNEGDPGCKQKKSFTKQRDMAPKGIDTVRGFRKRKH